MAGDGTLAGGLLERDRERERLRELLAATRNGRGAGLLVEGAAGIGKTALLRDMRAEASDAGVLVLRATGGELEREVPFGVVRQLLEPPLAAAGRDARRRLLDGAAARAAPVLSGVVDAPGGGADTLAVMHGLFWVCANLAERGATLLLVDDAHWADIPSLQWLEYLCRRLNDLPIALVVALRPAEPGGRGDFARGLLGDQVGEILHPAPLSQEAVAAVVGERLGQAEGVFCVACADVTHGNPFLLQELLRALRQDGIVGRDADVPQLERLRVSTVAHSILRRVARTGPAGVAIARAAVVLGRDAELRHAATLARLEPDLAAQAVDALIAAGILMADGPVEFAHPLVRTAVYEEMGPRGRSVQHRRAAEILAATGSDPQRVAVHLLGVDPLADGWVVDRLREAAAGALEAGAPVAAVEYLKRALEEPAPGEQRGPILLALGSALFFVDPGAAAETMRAVQQAPPDEQTWLVATLMRAKALSFADRPEESVLLLDEALGRSADLEPQTVLALESERSLWHLFWDANPDPAGSSAGIERLTAGIDGATKLERQLLSWRAYDWMLAGRDAGAAAELAARMLGPRPSFTDPELGFEMPTVAGLVLLYCDRIGEAARVFSDAIAELRGAGRLVQLAFSFAHSSNVAYRAGELREAEADAFTGWELAEQFGPALPAWWYVVGSLLQALIARGELQAAEQLVAEYGLGERRPAAIAFPVTSVVRGQLRIAQGRLEEGVADLLNAGEWAERRGFCNPSFIPWRAVVAPALAALGRSDEAEALIGESVVRARAFGGRWALGVSLRAAGLVRGGEQGLELLGEAVEVLEGSMARLELGQALVEHGAALRRANRRREAREPLLRGLDLADRCAATTLAKRAREELLTLGARPRRERLSGVESLTASELRVARLAAAGRTNRVIAQELFVTTKTVEAHLARAYRKLDITSRAALTDAIGGS